MHNRDRASEIQRRQIRREHPDRQNRGERRSGERTPQRDPNQYRRERTERRRNRRPYTDWTYSGSWGKALALYEE